jgi:hypothetical protein
MAPHVRMTVCQKLQLISRPHVWVDVNWTVHSTKEGEHLEQPMGGSGDEVDIQSQTLMKL